MTRADEERALTVLLECADGGNLALAADILWTYPPPTAGRLLREFRRRLRARLAGSPGARYSRAVELLVFLGDDR